MVNNALNEYELEFKNSKIIINLINNGSLKVGESVKILSANHKFDAKLSKVELTNSRAKFTLDINNVSDAYDNTDDTDDEDSIGDEAFNKMLHTTNSVVKDFTTESDIIDE
jgi:hypothetical protein